MVTRLGVLEFSGRPCFSLQPPGVAQCNAARPRQLVMASLGVFRVQFLDAVNARDAISRWQKGTTSRASGQTPAGDPQQQQVKLRGRALGANFRFGRKFVKNSFGAPFWWFPFSFVANGLSQMCCVVGGGRFCIRIV